MTQAEMGGLLQSSAGRRSSFARIDLPDVGGSIATPPIQIAQRRTRSVRQRSLLQLLPGATRASRPNESSLLARYSRFHAAPFLRLPVVAPRTASVRDRPGLPS